MRRALLSPWVLTGLLAGVPSAAAGTELVEFVEVQRDGVGIVDGLDSALAVAVSPGGAHVYAAGLDDDAIAVFSRDQATGALSFVEMERDGVGGVDGLDGPRAVAVSPDGANVYVTSGQDDALVVFSRDAATGNITFWMKRCRAH